MIYNISQYLALHGTAILNLLSTDDPQINNSTTYYFFIVYTYRYTLAYYYYYILHVSHRRLCRRSKPVRWLWAEELRRRRKLKTTSK